MEQQENKIRVSPFYMRGNAKFPVILLGMAYLMWFLISPNDPNKGHYAVLFGHAMWTPVAFPFYYVFMPIRVWASVWVSRVVVTLNRSSFGWAIFAFVCPIIALYFVNHLEKDPDYSMSKSKGRIIRKKINRGLAVFTGLVILVAAILVLSYDFPNINYLRRVQILLSFFAIKICAFTWAKRLAFGQNRNHTYWALAACLCSSVTLIALGFLPKLPQKAPSAPHWAKKIYTSIFYLCSLALFAADLLFLSLLSYDNWYGKEFEKRNELAFRYMGEERIRVYEGKKCGAINMWGKNVIPCYYQSIGSFSDNGLAPLKQYNKWGYIDKKGKIIIPCEFEDAEPFDKTSGLARVKLFGADEWEPIDKSGNLLTPIEKQSPPPDAEQSTPPDTLPDGEHSELSDEEFYHPTL
ncbi:MAG: WG repeat-containing protein, partial [Dysgonamonadaceae bacterium]|nr:WG repeat-containing protein [Dysgonamonadaceae bacterium]